MNIAIRIQHRFRETKELLAADHDVGRMASVLAVMCNVAENRSGLDEGEKRVQPRSSGQNCMARPLSRVFKNNVDDFVGNELMT